MTTMTTKAERIALLQGSLQDALFFYEHCFKIRDKNQALVPFKLNPPQLLIHNALEKQRRETGKVRAIILKSRRVGCSTLVAARFYRYATLKEGQSVAIVAHVQKTTGNLYRIVKRAHEHNPIAPSVGASNIREMIFDKLDSRYSVFSAETGEGGRGEDVTLLHLSEYAYYAKPKEIMAGIATAVPDKPGTEIIIESTAAGPSGEFYEMYQDAVNGKNEYLPIFVPWTADPDCSRDPGPDFEPEQERIDAGFPSEAELMEQYGVTEGQLAWRRATMRGPRNLHQFLKEYPLTESDAWSSSSEYSLINPADVLRARNSKLAPYGDKIIGVDPAGTGEDRFAIACRQGNVVKWVAHRTKVSTNEAVAWIKAVIEDERPLAVYIDAGGGGGGGAICSILQEDAAVSALIRPVNFGGRSQAKMARPDKPGPTNRRAEMWGRLGDWLKGETPVSLPDMEDISRDLATATVKELAAGDWRLEPKKGARSPDLGDAIALTFANRYVPKSEADKKADTAVQFNYGGQSYARPQSWMV